MNSRVSRAAIGSWETHLFGLSSLISVACLGFVWYAPESYTHTIPEVVVPLGISLALAVYTLWQIRTDPGADRSRVVKCGWAGAIVSGAIGSLWLGLHVYQGVPIDLLPDKILTVLSVGVGAGVLVGRAAGATGQAGRPPERIDLVGETSWPNRSTDSPVLDAILEILREYDEIEALELDPLHDQMDPGLLEELRAQDGTQWQLTFYLDDYEIRVSSHGTVSVYRFTTNSSDRAF